MNLINDLGAAVVLIFASLVIGMLLLVPLSIHVRNEREKKRVENTVKWLPANDPDKTVVVKDEYL